MEKTNSAATRGHQQKAWDKFPNSRPNISMDGEEVGYLKVGGGGIMPDTAANIRRENEERKMWREAIGN